MPRVDLLVMDSSGWEPGIAARALGGPGALDRVDLVFTHPYAPLPRSLRERDVARICNMHVPGGEGQRRHAMAERYAGQLPYYWGEWGENSATRNELYANRWLPEEDRPQVADLAPVPPGWMPLELPLRVLRAYLEGWPPGKGEILTVWDGFCGRGTIGLACQQLGLNYIGIDKDPERVRLAAEYLGVEIPQGVVQALQ